MLGLARRASGAGGGVAEPSSPGLRSLARHRVASTGRVVSHPGGSLSLGRPAPRSLHVAGPRGTADGRCPCLSVAPRRGGAPTPVWGVWRPPPGVVPSTGVSCPRGRPACCARIASAIPKRGWAQRSGWPRGRVAGGTGGRGGVAVSSAPGGGPMAYPCTAGMWGLLPAAAPGSGGVEETAPGASRARAARVATSPDRTAAASHPPSATAQRWSRWDQEAAAGGRWCWPWRGLAGGSPSAAVWGVRDLTY